MADLAAIREGLAANLSAIPDVQVSAYMLASPSPPAIHVIPGQTMYDQAMGRGLDRVEMRVQAFTAITSDIGSQVNLDEMLDGSGARSVKAAVESDKTLGGAAHDVWVSTATGYQQLARDGQAAVLMSEWTVVVHARGA